MPSAPQGRTTTRSNVGTIAVIRTVTGDIAGLAGRSRSYVLEMPDGMARAAAAIALSHRCDALVAAAQGKPASGSGLERAALDLLSSKALTSWITAAFGEASGR